MTNQIPIEEALKLVQFKQGLNGSWYVESVKNSVRGNVEGSVGGNVYGHVGGHVGGNVCGIVGGNVEGDVEGNVCGDVEGSVGGNVYGHVGGDVGGNVCGIVGGNVGEVGGTVRTTINGRQWKFVETPKEKLKRLIDEGADKAQLLDAFNQLEESND